MPYGVCFMEVQWYTRVDGILSKQGGNIISPYIYKLSENHYWTNETKVMQWPFKDALCKPFPAYEAGAVLMILDMFCFTQKYYRVL